MRRYRRFIGPVWSNPIARCVAALLLFCLSLGGLAVTAYGDQLENGGISYSPPAKPIPYTDVDPLGVNTFLEKEVEPANVSRSLDMIRDGGFKWIRQTFPWNDIEISAKGDFTDRRNPSHVHSAWDKYDFIVDEAAKRGIGIIARLDTIPVWARRPGDDIEKFTKGPPRDNQDYADFAGAVAQRYKGKVRFYQLWNEPNLYGEWGGFPPDPVQYTQLLKAGYQAIKAVDPQAVVICAALAPTIPDNTQAMNDVLFLERMYSAGARPYFDIMSTMLYGLGQPPEERRVDLKRLSFSRPILLREVMERNGDANKPIWISEYAWLSLPPDWEQTCAKLKADNKDDPSKWCGENIWGPNVDEVTQAEWEVRGFERARSEWPWLGVMNVWYFREPDPDPKQPASYFAIVKPDYTARPAYNALRAYSATLTGARPVAHKPLWNAVGFPFLYGLFGLFAVASAGLGVSSLGRWAGAAMDIPRGRYRETVREAARNGAVVVGMALLVGLYYKTGSVPVMLVALAGWWALAVVKPSTALAGVAFAIPFFWQPKEVGAQRFPIAETLLWLTFAAVVVRHGLVRFAQPVARRLRIYESFTGQTEMELGRYLEEWGLDGSGGVNADGNGAALPVVAASQPVGPMFTHPIEVPAQEEIEPANWPARPRPVRYRYFSQPLPRPGYLLSTYQQVTQAATTNGQQSIITAPIEEEERATNPDQLSPDMLPTERVRLHFPSRPLRLASRPAATPAQPMPRTWRGWLEWARARFLEWEREDAFAPPAVAMLLLGLLSLVTMADPAFAPDTARAFRWDIIEPVLFYFLLTDVIKNRRSLLRLADFFVGAGVVVALVGLGQFAQNTNVLDVEGVSRILSVYQHPDNLALYLGRVVPFAACLAIFLPWGWRKLIFATITVPMAGTLLLTFSRAGWLAAAVGVLVAVGVGLRWRSGREARELSRRARLAVAGGVAVLAVLAVVAAAVVIPRLPARILNGSSGVLRFSIWKTAGHMLLDHPILGIGPDQFLNQFRSDRYLPLYKSYLSPGQVPEEFTAHPHDIILDWWLTLGIMGLFVLIWLMWKYFREATNRVKVFAAGAGADPVGRALALGLIASMVDFLVHGLVDNSYFLMDLALTFWLSCALVQVLRKT